MSYLLMPPPPEVKVKSSQWVSQSPYPPALPKTAGDRNPANMWVESNLQLELRDNEDESLASAFAGKC